MTPRQSIFWPFTLPYGAVVSSRALAYRKGILRQRQLDGVVISVGNLTTGGTGKTPTVLWIAERLAAEGKSTGILTRGYRGAASASGSTSDEVQLLQARLGDRVAFGVGADRFAEGRRLAERGVEWFVLDDGFQHLQLARDVDIVLIDATNPFGGGYLLPAGRLREPRSALARADVILITRSDRAPALEAAIRRYSTANVFYARAALDSLRIFRGGESCEEIALKQDRRYFAFCGIGNPPAFLADLREWGFAVAGHAFFADHHRYTPGNARTIEAAARKAGADALICTEKDIFNLGFPRGAAGALAFELFYCRISMMIDREEEFWRTVMAFAESRVALRDAAK